MTDPIYIVADDHPLVLNGVKGVLEEMDPGCKIFDAVSYSEVLELIHEDCDVNLIIADLNMPGMAPHEAIQTIQEKRPDIPLMIISATQNRHVIEKTMGLGINGYMLKSYSQAQMIHAIKTVLNGDIYTPDDPGDIEGIDTSFPTQAMELFGAAALNRMPVGVIVVSDKAKVLFKNDAAFQILDQKDGLVEDNQNILRTSNQDLTRHLHGIIQTAAKGDGHEREGGALSIDRPSMKRAFSLMLVPLPVEDNLQISQDTSAIFITDPEKPFEPPTKILARLYNLTEAEARLLQALIVGKKLERVASDFGVSVNTVRSHLKQVFRKTNTNRQSELVSLAMNSSAYIATEPDNSNL